MTYYDDMLCNDDMVYFYVMKTYVYLVVIPK